MRAQIGEKARRMYATLAAPHQQHLTQRGCTNLEFVKAEPDRRTELRPANPISLGLIPAHSNSHRITQTFGLVPLPQFHLAASVVRGGAEPRVGGAYASG